MAVAPNLVPGFDSSTTITNKVTVSSSSVDDDPLNNLWEESTTVERLSGMWVSISDTPDPVVWPGVDLTYRIGFGNNGPSNSKGQRVIVTLPDGILPIRVPVSYWTVPKCDAVDPLEEWECVELGPGTVEVKTIKRNGQLVYDVVDPENTLAPGESYTFDLPVKVSDSYILDGLGNTGADECGTLAEDENYAHFAYTNARVSSISSLGAVKEYTRINAPSIGKRYAYFTTIPGAAGDYYKDDFSEPDHSVHSAGLGVFSKGELTDGAVGQGCENDSCTSGDVEQPSEVVGIVGDGFDAAEPVQIIIELEGLWSVDSVIIGTSVRSFNGQFGGAAPVLTPATWWMRQ